MRRRAFTSSGLALSYLDSGGPGELLIALHSHWMDATTFIPLAEALAPAWRVVALDQRGHGFSDHAPSYRREDYLRDLDALFAHLGSSGAVLLGNSLGGVNAYQYAARAPERVRGLIIEDIGAEVHDDLSFVRPWAGTFASRAELEARIGPRLTPYVASSFRETPKGWKVAFEPDEMLASQEQLNGDHWADWLGSSCPALLIHGRESRVTTLEAMEQMAARRPNTRLVTLEGGHVVHVDNFEGFLNEVGAFLSELDESRVSSGAGAPHGAL